MQGEHPEAQDYLVRSLDMAWRIQNVPLVIHAVVYVAEVLSKQNRDEDAICLLRFTQQHAAAEQEDKDLVEELLSNLKQRRTPELEQKALGYAKTTNLEDVVEELLRQTWE